MVCRRVGQHPHHLPHLERRRVRGVCRTYAMAQSPAGSPQAREGDASTRPEEALTGFRGQPHEGVIVRRFIMRRYRMLALLLVSLGCRGPLPAGEIVIRATAQS